VPGLEREIVDGDHLIAIFASYLKEKGQLKNDTVVVTEMSNYGFYRVMQKLGIHTRTVDVGDRYVVEAMRECDFILGGEQAGHIVFSRHSTTGDGTIAGLQICDIMLKRGKKLSELAEIMQKAPQVLINIDVKEKVPLGDLPKTQEAIALAEEELEDKGRVLVRYSGTQDICRVMVEGLDEAKVQGLADKIAHCVREEIGY